MTAGSDASRGVHFPLTPLDDLPIHQSPEPVRVMWTSDVRAYERYWTVMYNEDASLVVAVGGSFYPNLDAAESYAIVNLRGDHRSVRALRPLGRDRGDMAVGPVRPTVVEGLRTWRHELDLPEQNLRYELTFTDTTQLEFRERKGRSGTGFPPGRPADVTVGFEGFGAVGGWVEVDGERIVLDPERCRGTRDRHWGLGRDVGGTLAQVPGSPETAGLSGNTFVPFDGWALWGDRVFHPVDAPAQRATRVRTVSRRLRFEPETHIFVEGVIDYERYDGSAFQVHYERIGVQTAFMRCGMYGGSPTGRYQGERVSELVVESDRYDVTVASNRRLLAGLDEHLCRVTCGDQETIGIYQPIDPAAYEACVAGIRGWSLL